MLFGGEIDWDEGVYWQSLRSLVHGHALYAEVYSSQPPGFLLLLAPVFRLGEQTLAGGRAGVFVLALVGTVATYHLGNRWTGSGAGLLAATLLSLDPLFFRQSIALMADGPSTSLSLVAVALAAQASDRQGRWAWTLAAASGGTLALAAGVKLLAVAAMVPIALTLRARSGLLAATAGGGLAALAAMVAPLAPHWPQVWAQAVGLHLASRGLAEGGVTPELLGTVAGELPLILAATAGLVMARPPLGIAAAWLVAQALVVAVQHPLWPHHIVSVSAPLALLGSGLARPLRLAGWTNQRVIVPGVSGALAALLVGSTLVTFTLQATPPERAREVALLRSSTSADDLVITDDQFAAAEAGRSTPPLLVDTSLVRIQSGQLSTADVLRAADNPQVGAVLFANFRLRPMPGLENAIQIRFPHVIDLDDGARLYLRHPVGARTAPSQPSPWIT